MKIIVDTREHGPHGLTSTRKSRAQEYYSSKGYDCEIQQLTYGDYLFNNQVVFEYKLIDDLMKSITNGRLFDECVNQTVTYPYSYLIVEGNLQDYILDSWESYIVRKQYTYDYQKYIKSTYARYEGAIRRVQTICPVIYAASESVAFQEMLLQAQKCCESKVYGSEVKNL
ncbi:MAG: ERCC4 domain-containing protein, partial [Prevotella sp.]|nr:ERCC4 domain-containing protein [Prevotella sp.]